MGKLLEHLVLLQRGQRFPFENIMFQFVILCFFIAVNKLLTRSYTFLNHFLAILPQFCQIHISG